jgi:uncharacterized protein
MSHGLARLAAFASAMLSCCFFMNTASPATAQGSYMDVEGVQAAMQAGNDASMASYAYREKEWDVAFDRGRKACDGNEAMGCVILGMVLAEGRLGAPDPRGAETAHRKAASLYSARCKDASSDSDTCADAGDFYATNAVTALRNERLARTYYTRARDGYSESCNRNGYECNMAGLLTEGNFTGRPDAAQAVRLWRRGCEDDDASDRLTSCDKLVERLANGPAGIQNQPEARKLIEAGQCSAAAPGTGGTRRVNKLYCAIVAEFLFDGVGGPVNAELAERLMRYSCEDGQESACRSLENRGFKRDDMKSALALRDLGLSRGARERFETLCTAQNGFACNEAGRIYNREQSAEDKAKALQLYGRACTLGEIVGCANQGSVLQARGGEANLVAARVAFGKACDAKDAQACRQLGRLLSQGRGGIADRAGAIPLYEIACNGNDADGCFYLAYGYSNGVGVPADLTRIRSLYEKACELGSSGGCNNLADALETGRGGPVDLVRARSLYDRACKANNGFACNSLGTFNRDGLGGAANPVTARALVEKACNTRIAKACNNLSDSLLSSAGGPTDRIKAITIRRAACFAMDDQDACTWLTEGGHRDPAEEGIILANSDKIGRALPLLREACNAGNQKGCVGLAAFTPPNAMSRDERMAILKKACAVGNKDGCEALAMFE